MRKIKSIILLFVSLLLIDISNSKEVSPPAYTVCYFSFDLERYAPSEERTIHASRCYLITDAEFEKINSLIKASPTPDHLTQYNPSNSKVFIYNSTRKIYVVVAEKFKPQQNLEITSSIGSAIARVCEPRTSSKARQT